MRKSSFRIADDFNLFLLPDFIDLCRNGNSRVFVRKRKFGIDDLIYSSIVRKGQTLTMEIRNYMKTSHPGVQISKVGYLKQRMKLNPLAFKVLYQHHNKNFYSDSETVKKTYNGYLVLAADGSDINVPTCQETLEYYGNSSIWKDGKQVASLSIECLYDVLNHMILDNSINKYKYNEGKAIEPQLNDVRKTIGDLPFFTLFDRGYPSIPFILRMIDSSKHFVIRLKDIDFRAERKKMSGADEDVVIELTNSRRNNYKGKPDEEIMFSRDSFTMRIVKVTLENGSTEYLATTLPRETFPADNFAEIYHLRWGIETAYSNIKDKLKLEDFTGTKPILIEQDIYSTIYVCNLAEDIIKDVEEENAEKYATEYKHKMAVNRNVSYGILKNDLIYAIMSSDTNEKQQILQDIYDEISRNIVPIRDNRHYPRYTGVSKCKYSNTHKRSY